MRKNKEILLSFIVHSSDFTVLLVSMYASRIWLNISIVEVFTFLFPFFFFNLNFSRFRDTLYLPFSRQGFSLLKSTIYSMIFNWVSFVKLRNSIAVDQILFYHSLYILGLVVLRPLFHFLIHKGLFKNKGLRNIIILGNSSDKTKMVSQVIENFSLLKYNIQGVIESTESNKSKDLLKKYFDEYCIFEVFYFLSETNHHQLKDIVPMCQNYGIRLRIFVDFQQQDHSGTTKLMVDSIGPVDSFIISNIPEKYLRLKCKRLLDIVFSIIFIILFMPIFIITAIIIKLTSKGPVIFSQVRSGQYGRTFKMFKFRTMVNNAPELLNQLSSQNEANGPVFKMKDDPRVTPVGKILRKWSIDELPQLFNVLKGELSLVGARPPIPAEVAQYSPWQMRRLCMPPGLTCFWQISGRSDINFDRWMELDLKYIDNWSLMLDFKILLKTIPAILMAKGSY